MTAGKDRARAVLLLPAISESKRAQTINCLPLAATILYPC